MRTRIKFCGLVRPGDVDAAVSIGADAIGFVFYAPSPRHIDADTARDLRRRLPSFVRAVGLFVNAPLASIRSIRDVAGLDVIQFHGDESPADLAAAVASGLTVWRAHRVLPGQDLAAAIAATSAAEFHLLDSHSKGYGGSGKPFDWSIADGIDPSRLIVSGGIRPDNVGEAIDRLGPFAVDTSSGIQGETARIKDVSRMAAFVDAVRSADGRRAAVAAAPEPVASRQSPTPASTQIPTPSPTPTQTRH